jgi:hypothetical protein
MDQPLNFLSDRDECEWWEISNNTGDTRGFVCRDEEEENKYALDIMLGLGMSSIVFSEL